MAGESYLEFRNFTTGARIAVVTGATGSSSAARNGFLRLTTVRKINMPDRIEVDLPGDFPGLWSLADKTQVIHWRRDVDRGIDWYREAVGLYRDVDYKNQQGKKIVTLTCPGLLS